MANYFSNAREFTLNSPNFSNVGGDQYIYNIHTKTVTTTQHKSRLRIQGIEEEEDEFEQYYEVKRADVELNRAICSYRADESWRKRRFDCEKKFFVGEIVRGDGQSSGLMVVGYEGREAQEAWLEDFQRTTGFLSVESAHLLAISRSKIPLLIFTRGLVPATQFLANVGKLGMTYFVRLSKQLGCDGSEVWLDPQRGALCRGPEGPKDEWTYVPGLEGVENVPSSVELLQEDVFRRFLTGFKSVWADDIVVRALILPTGQLEDADLQFTHPTVISPLTNTPIAASGVTSSSDRSNDKLGDLLGNGLTRYRLDDPPAEMSLRSANTRVTWLSQAWSVFHAHGLSLEDDLSQYKLITPNIYWFLSFSQSERERRRRRQQPIFLFIRPLPSTPLRSCTTSAFHYWSFDKDGQSLLTPYMCHYLGLPIVLVLKLYRCIVSTWPNDFYKTIRRYQVTRGFDPRTTDFARSLGHPEFKSIFNRFEETGALEDSTVPSTMGSDWTSVEDPRSLPRDEVEASSAISIEDWIFAEGETHDSSEHSESCSLPQAPPATTQKGSLFSKMKW